MLPHSKNRFFCKTSLSSGRKQNQSTFSYLFSCITVLPDFREKLDYKYTCEEILDTLKSMNFAEIQEQGFIPLYKRSKLTDGLHDACGFHTDYQFITKSQLKTIQKKSKGKE